jgi:hypothetical protein
VVAVKATQNPPTSTPAADVTPADILRNAARYLHRYGWTQGDFFNTTLTGGPAFPPACATGAITMAVYGHPTDPRGNDPEYDDRADLCNRAMRCLDHFLSTGDYVTDPDPFGRVCPSPIEVVTDWNDEEGRTLDEVTAALTDAADQWDTTHAPGGENA